MGLLEILDDLEKMNKNNLKPNLTKISRQLLMPIMVLVLMWISMSCNIDDDDVMDGQCHNTNINR